MWLERGASSFGALSLGRPGARAPACKVGWCVTRLHHVIAPPGEPSECAIEQRNFVTWYTPEARERGSQAARTEARAAARHAGRPVHIVPLPGLRDMH